MAKRKKVAVGKGGKDTSSREYLINEYDWADHTGEYLALKGRASFNGYSGVISTCVNISARWISIGKGVWKLLDESGERLIAIWKGRKGAEVEDVGINEDICFVHKDCHKKIMKEITRLSVKKDTASKGTGWNISNAGEFDQCSFSRFEQVMRDELRENGGISKQKLGKGDTFQVIMEKGKSLKLEWSHTGKVWVSGKDWTNKLSSESVMKWFRELYVNQFSEGSEDGIGDNRYIDEEDLETIKSDINRQVESKGKKGKKREREREVSPESDDAMMERGNVMRGGLKRGIRTPEKLVLELDSVERKEVQMVIKMGEKEGLDEVMNLIERWMVGTLSNGKYVEKGKSEKEEIRLRALFVAVKIVVNTWGDGDECKEAVMAALGKDEEVRYLSVKKRTVIYTTAVDWVRNFLSPLEKLVAKRVERKKLLELEKGEGCAKKAKDNYNERELREEISRLNDLLAIGKENGVKSEKIVKDKVENKNDELRGVSNKKDSLSESSEEYVVRSSSERGSSGSSSSSFTYGKSQVAKGMSSKVGSSNVGSVGGGKGDNSTSSVGGEVGNGGGSGMGNNHGITNDININNVKIVSIWDNLSLEELKEKLNEAIKMKGLTLHMENASIENSQE
jgi:hypothetical protein